MFGFLKRAPRAVLCNPDMEPGTEVPHPVLGRSKVIPPTHGPLRAAVLDARNAANLGAYHARKGNAQAAAILREFEAGRYGI